MFNQQTKVIRCSDVDLDNYRIYYVPYLDIAYFDDNVPYNPILATDWIKINTDDVTDTHIYIPNNNNDGTHHLLRIMDHVEGLIYSLYKYTENDTIFHHPTIMTDRMKHRDKLTVPIKSTRLKPFLKPLELHKRSNDPIEIKFIGSFSTKYTMETQNGISFGVYYMEFSILDVVFGEVYNDEHLTDDINDLSLMVTI